MPGRVVLAEAEPGLAAAIAARLTAAYLDVIPAEGHLSAMSLAASEGADLLVLGSDAGALRRETTCRIVAGTPATAHVPVMAVLAETRRGEAVRLLDAGADDVLALREEAAALPARALNLLRAKLARDPLRIAQGLPDAPGPRGSFHDVTRSVLLVGDEGGLRRAVRASLRGRPGVRVARAADGGELRARLAGGADDLYVIGPAAGDGALRLAGLLRASPVARASPILVVDGAETAPGGEAVALGLADGAAPLDRPAEIAARVRALLRRRARDEALAGGLAALVAEAGCDPLTGLPNRRTAEARLAAMVATAAGAGRPLAVMMLDLDGFKAINDRSGHPAGDAALREAASRFRAALRTCDLLARVGGDEFLAAAFGLGCGAAAEVAERMRRSLGAGLTVSVGVAALEAGETAGALVGRADAALYRAKAGGRNRVAAASADDG